MKAVFGDTFYWIALTLPEDASHDPAKLVTADIVTTEEVRSDLAYRKEVTQFRIFKSRTSSLQPAVG